MIALDTNVLVYAHRTEAPKHARALSWLTHLAEGDTPWGLPVFALGEFLRVVTHRSIFSPPSPLAKAIPAMESLLASPSIRLISPGPDYVQHFHALVKTTEATGNLVFDAQIAALCREHGIETLLTEDRDFSRFPGLRLITLDSDPG